MHNLKTVYLFEVIRTLKKKSFWIMAIAFPVTMAAMFGVIFLSNQATSDIAEKMKDSTFNMAITDNSVVLSSEAIQALKAKQPTSK